MKKFLLPSAFIVVLVFVFFFAGRFLEKSFSPLIFRVASSISSRPAVFEPLFDLAGIIFKDKDSLVRENNSLKQKVGELETKLESISVLGQEYKDFLGEKTKVWANIIFRPPSLSFDQIIINKGSNDGIKKEWKIVVNENIVLGDVVEVFDKFSRVSLYSGFDREIPVILKSSGSEIFINGMSNGEYNATVPKEFNLEPGDVLFTLDSNPLIVGVVDSVESVPNSQLKKGKIILPVNLNRVNTVGVMP